MVSTRSFIILFWMSIPLSFLFGLIRLPPFLIILTYFPPPIFPSSLPDQSILFTFTSSFSPSYHSSSFPTILTSSPTLTFPPPCRINPSPHLYLFTSYHLSSFLIHPYLNHFTPLSPSLFFVYLNLPYPFHHPGSLRHLNLTHPSYLMINILSPSPSSLKHPIPSTTHCPTSPVPYQLPTSIYHLHPNRARSSRGEQTRAKRVLPLSLA